MRVLAFSKRVTKEILRDPLSYIFCLGFPILMLLLFTVISAALPAQAQMTVFMPRSITPGIAMFGLCFVMLFTALTVSRDRESCLLLRLYISPMRAADFLLGYILPALVLSLAQAAICFLAGGVIGAVTGDPLPLVGCLRSLLSLLPGMLLFIALGLLLGSCLNDKAAPGVTSILITAASLLGGVWMPLEQMEGFREICAWLPFYHCVEAARAAVTGAIPLGRALVVTAYAAVIGLLAVLAFRRKMKV